MHVLENGKLLTCPKCGKPLELLRINDDGSMILAHCDVCDMDYYKAMLGGPKKEDHNEEAY